ncbi:MAG: hypothetical protein Q4C95_07400 [Planctomycetia bacterium]|nr:hypothetical protein [Planctomycetia bacterium]
MRKYSLAKKRVVLFMLTACLTFLFFEGGCQQQTLVDSSSTLSESEKQTTSQTEVMTNSSEVSSEVSSAVSSEVSSTVDSNEKNAEIPNLIHLAEAQGIVLARNSDHSIKAIDFSALDNVIGIDPKDWEQLKKVRVLKGRGRLSPKLILSLEKMPQLTEFLWADVRLDEGEYLWPLLKISPKLKKVRLTGLTSENALPILDVLAECPSLEELDISSSEITDDVLARINFPAMTKLTKLNLYQLPVSNVVASALLPLKDQLLWLNLDATKIDETVIPELSQFQQLKFLHLGRTNISSACFDSLSKMNSLETLYITRTKINEIEANILRGKLPSCKIISQIEK